MLFPHIKIKDKNCNYFIIFRVQNIRNRDSDINLL